MQENFKSVRRLRYELPTTVEPAESVCIEVHVPNDINYIAAFWGQMFALTRWYAWAGDDDHTAKQVAAVWRGVYEAAQESECENVLVRTSPFNSCELQVSYDGGVVWETKFNARPCAITAINDTLGSGSDNGAAHPQPGAQPGGGNPSPGQCFDLDLTISGSGQTLIPIKVASGWTLTFSQIKGAWSDDNSLAALWSCPNGYPFVLGSCGSGGVPAHSTDPLQTAYHMQLLLWQPDGSYVAVQDNVPYPVPGGLPDGNYLLLANDAERSNNQGSVSLHLEACNTPQCASVLHYEWGTGPSLFPDVGQNWIATSEFQPAVNPEQTFWIYWNSPMRLKLVDIGSWAHYDFPANFHTWAYAPSNVDGANLGAYTFFDAPSVTTLPLNQEITMNGFYTRAAPGNQFTLTFEVIRCGY